MRAEHFHGAVGVAQIPLEYAVDTGMVERCQRTARSAGQVTQCCRPDGTEVGVFIERFAGQKGDDSRE